MSETPKVFIKTYGCSFNQLDSQIMAGHLKKADFTLSESDEDSNLILINSCTVKNASESKFFQDIKEYQKRGKKIVLSGCITQAEESYLTNELKGISVIGTNDLDKIVHVANNTLKDNPIQFVSKLGRRKENELNRLEKERLRLSSPKHSSSLTHIIPINEGCLNTCSFCKTKQARGQLFSYSIVAIKQAVERALEQGAQEIYLTSQDTGCYGFDIGTNLPELLRELLTLEGDFRIRIGMGNPNHFKKVIDEMLEIMLEDERVYRFLHIPLQAGSNRILDEMRRMYHLKEFKEIVVKAKLKIPDITFANDIIVAYPTETQNEFEETLKSLEWARTNVLNYSRFWLRPGTPAEHLYSSKDYIDGAESKRRVRILKEKFEKIAYENNQKWIGWEGEVLVTEKIREGVFRARNDYYKNIHVKGDLQVGQRVFVKITKANWNAFEAELLE